MLRAGASIVRGLPALGEARALSTASKQSYREVKEGRKGDISKLVEVVQRKAFAKELEEGLCARHKPATPRSLAATGLASSDVLRILQAGMATSLLHVESRIASLLGEGFYTIGPAGEELMAGVALSLRDDDAVALHYRHLALQIARQMKNRDLADILLDRARGYTVSSLDPVTGGGHCALGGGKYDFLVTSTLASQGPPAVGRALGNSLAHHMKVDSPFPKDFVSFVSCGDGSVNNAHMLSAVNMADYAQHRGYRCPTVFCVTNNDICISLPGHDWVKKWTERLRMPVVVGVGNDIADCYAKSKEAINKARSSKGPVCLLLNDIPRRFGHAATDRQNAYKTTDDIRSLAEENPLAGACATAVEEGFATYEELHRMFTQTEAMVEDAFAAASREPKITTRKEVMSRTSQPLVSLPPAPKKKEAGGKRDVMRKHMTQYMEEALEEYPNCVYVGEDVTHGGYYLVTDGLHKKYPVRVRDFPPDETALVGAAMGYSQAGLLPILEIPYAKYLDCGGDMFFEAAIQNWLSAGQQPMGMMIRLQGFDRGIFGGNFHTHNQLHLPPGIHVVCYSNGRDYVRGWRYSMKQAQAGNIVMSVDSTNLLNLRHVMDRDEQWLTSYPQEGDYLSFDEVISHGNGKDIAIVTYGNGVVTALQAVKKLEQKHSVAATVIDCPLLSSVPKGLPAALKKFDRVVFADVCKEGASPLSGHVMALQSSGKLPAKWRYTAAQRTYNPLGNTLTFLSTEDIIGAAKALS